MKSDYKIYNCYLMHDKIVDSIWDYVDENNVETDPFAASEQGQLQQKQILHTDKNA